MNDQQIVHVLRMAADTLQKVINRNQKLDQEINQLKLKYQKDVEQIRSIADDLIRRYNGTSNLEEKKTVVDEAKQKSDDLIKKERDALIAGLPSHLQETILANAKAIKEVKPAPLFDSSKVRVRISPFTALHTIKNLKPRTYSAFKKVNAKVVKDLENVTRRQLLKMDNVGEKTVAEIRDVMAQAGYKMRPE
jgi:DNA-directed RNA polymerase alpha subunit